MNESIICGAYESLSERRFTASSQLSATTVSTRSMAGFDMSIMSITLQLNVNLFLFMDRINGLSIVVSLHCFVVILPTGRLPIHHPALAFARYSHPGHFGRYPYVYERDPGGISLVDYRNGMQKS